MTNRYIVAAAAAIVIVVTLYVAKFHLSLGYAVSDEPAVWGMLGDYLGGVLNPILSFISVVLLIKSLTLQNEANLSLRADLGNSEKTEKIRSFEALFFSIIESQKELFKYFKIETGQENVMALSGIESVLWLEGKVEELRQAYGPEKELASAEAVLKFIENVDSRDHIFGITRAFYIAVKLINDKLGADQGFDKGDRRVHFLTLINFTDYAQLRLVLICVQFMKFHSVEYLKGDDEFTMALEEVGLSYNLY